MARSAFLRPYIPSLHELKMERIAHFRVFRDFKKDFIKFNLSLSRGLTLYLLALFFKNETSNRVLNHFEGFFYRSFFSFKTIFFFVLNTLYYSNIHSSFLWFFVFCYSMENLILAYYNITLLYCNTAFKLKISFAKIKQKEISFLLHCFFELNFNRRFKGFSQFFGKKFFHFSKNKLVTFIYPFFIYEDFIFRVPFFWFFFFFYLCGIF